MWFIGVQVEQETSAPPPKKNPGSAPDLSFVGLWKNTANSKEVREDDRVQACLLSYLSKELLIFS